MKSRYLSILALIALCGCDDQADPLANLSEAERIAVQQAMQGILNPLANVSEAERIAGSAIQGLGVESNPKRATSWRCRSSAMRSTTLDWTT